MISVSPSENANGWAKYYIPFSSFSFDGSQSGSSFGCSSSGPWSGELVKVDLRNPNTAYEALLCVDNVRLL
ncbi:hypothetical protein GPECTOR_89g497 [Gonium pectorale]|uniref:Uncharacterized protein n=1 Tax=Gonium pectorale TaxID=33097 RepID=A0A150G0W4_GONPE|nr:hypothetical protein GPECTOR_89g497 [Gonium pectorale]|eukprot:KXZ43477.1 hypothetical protein GPECTOR_89g497 [Gonium pectorale]